MSFLNEYHTDSSSTSGSVPRGHVLPMKRRSDSESDNYKRRKATTDSDLSSVSVCTNNQFHRDFSPHGIREHYDVTPKQLVGGSGGSVEVNITRSSPAVNSSPLARIERNSSGQSNFRRGIVVPMKDIQDVHSFHSSPPSVPSYYPNPDLILNSDRRGYRGMETFPLSSRSASMSPMEQHHRSYSPLRTNMISSSPVFPLNRSNNPIVQFFGSSALVNGGLVDIDTQSSGRSHFETGFVQHSQHVDSLQSPPPIFPTYPENFDLIVNNDPSSNHGMGNFPTSSQDNASAWQWSPELLRSSPLPITRNVTSNSPAFRSELPRNFYDGCSPLAVLSPQIVTPPASACFGSAALEHDVYTNESNFLGFRKSPANLDSFSSKENIHSKSTPFDISRSYKSSNGGNSSSGQHLPRRLFGDLSSNSETLSRAGSVRTGLHSRVNLLRQGYTSSGASSSRKVNSSRSSLTSGNSVSVDGFNGVSGRSLTNLSSIGSTEELNMLHLLAQPFYVFNEGPPIRLNLQREYFVGGLSESCKFCKALYFPGEVTKNEKIYTKCCGKGKIKVDRRSDFPEYLHDLFSGKSSDSTHFRDNIRKFNSAFGFASFGHESETVSGKGPYCFKIGGSVHHKIATSVNPIAVDGNESRRSYCQVYVLDTQEATKTRFEHPANENLLMDIMENVHRILKDVHPFANILHDMKSLMDKEKSLAEKDNRPSVDFTLRILDGYNDANNFSGSYDVITANEVAFIYKSVDDDQPPGVINRAIHSRSSNKLQFLPHYSSLIDPLTYPLFFPRGEKNWAPSPSEAPLSSETPSSSEGANSKDISLSMQKWYRHALQIRPFSEGFSPILIGGKLTDQYVCDVRLRIEGRNLDWVRHNQSKIRVESYLGLHEHLRKEAFMRKKTVGRVFVLPSTYTGGPRYMSGLYNDAMAMVTELGAPDYFVTMTCNPEWKEITDNLGYAKTSNERKDLIVRVFYLKLEELLRDIVVNHFFGEIAGFNYSIEFQKRGLPHAHIIIILQKAYKPKFASDVDQYVCAELPNESVHPVLFSRVKRSMMHGPCKGSKCWEYANGKWGCSKGFPKAFQERTDFNVNSYPLYKRRDNKGKCPDVNNSPVDNSYVVPYNPTLLMKYNCHINVEIVSSIEAIKYIYKYCFKGVDRLCFKVVDENTLDYDEVSAYTNGRYLCAAEAFWRIFEFPMSGRSHFVIRLPVHEEFMQGVVFTEGKEREAFEKAQTKGTKLTDYFRLNREDPRARNLLYQEIPIWYSYDPKLCRWKVRKSKAKNIIVRIHDCTPRDIERHCIRRLLLHRKGCTSFEDLRTVDGVIFGSFKEAAESLRLIKNSDYFTALFDAAVMTKFPQGLRDLLVSCCSVDDTSNVSRVWAEYKSHLVEDFIHRGCSLEESNDRGLIEISNGLAAFGATLEKVGLPEPSRYYDDFESPPSSDLDEIRKLCGLLNKDQMVAVQQVLTSVGKVCRKSFLQFSPMFFPQLSPGTNPPKLFFLDGAGGTGKTFVYSLLCKIFDYSGIKHITVAPTGIAASILPNGRTAHSKFGIPLDLKRGVCSSISYDDVRADDIRAAKVVIWDEIGMTQRKVVEITNKLFLDLRHDASGRRYTEPFGGCILIAGGDFRQQGPVVKRARRSEFLSYSVKSLANWNSFKKLSLHVNMRAGPLDQVFGAFLLKIGNNSFSKPPGIPADYMEVPPEYLIDSSKNKDALIDFIFGKDLSACDPLDFTNRAILCPRNADALRMNEVILRRIPGEMVTSFSVDSAHFDSDQTFNVYTEYLNTLTPGGCPPHVLNLKKNCVVMLLRNINPEKGLVNGTRLIVKQILEHYLDCEILVGAKKGQRCFLAKLEISPTDTDLPFKFKRYQFPVRVCYAMTIAKSQGQSLDYVGIYLNSDSFCHGQIYTAFSRARFPQNLKIDVVNSYIKVDGKIYIKNVVFKELL